MVWSKPVGMATRKPRTVVTKAPEIPPAIALGSPAPKMVIAWKVTIMPVTVPSSPINGATAEMIYNEQAGKLAAPFSMDRFSEGRLIDESAAAAVAH